ncbi:hypothetical protein PRIPAC_90184 [Pristionchus pacificus]|uniref:G protein-coupled receptor n=1 Tax=Pristionchus pacificus TaxID=54126 RepID=A0A2A6CV35_PRIPA|nr:hypothetical protein PRIPAC_90184 [Pristionchus pacificus]|eukprot:PDM81988.1 G protein-coupled receptor [Pristionchus pacificus]
MNYSSLDDNFEADIDIFHHYSGVVNAYFSCVYYRLNIVLPSANHSIFRRIGLFFILQSVVGAICACGYFVLNEARSSNQKIPDFLCWATCKVSFLLLHETFLLYAFGTVACLWGFCMFVVIAGMIARVLKELRGGMQKASTTTRMYQKRAIISLVFQGTIPSIFYVLPALVEALLYLITLIQGLETAALNSLMSSASAIAFSLITAHTVAHSITVVACSPAYKKTIRRLVVESINVIRGRSSVDRIRTRQSLQVSRFDYSRY